MNVPASQHLHADKPVVSENVPAAHGVTAVDPTPHAWPAVHSEQPSVAPSAVLRSVALPNRPDGHESGAEAPSTQYEPASHALQLCCPLAL